MSRHDVRLSRYSTMLMVYKPETFFHMRKYYFPTFCFSFSYPFTSSTLPTSMKKTKKSKRLNRKKSKSTDKGQKFRLSATSGHLIPLQTIRQRIKGIWQSLTWPICVKILKANIAVTIALALLLIDPVRNVSSTGGILASVAVEFVHPAKSYGFLAEDILLGTIMCCISGSWAILGTYLASLVRDPNDPTMAQPDVCAILSCFLVIGCFFLSMFRIKVEQANVGGMLSASIMVISLTSAVTHREFTATTTVSHFFFQLQCII